jgi:hypothetical protein
MKVEVLNQPAPVVATIPNAGNVAPSPQPTPSQQIVNRANKTAVVVDAKGRTIAVKKLSALDRVRMLSMAGGERSVNDQLMLMVMLAFAVTALDGEPVSRPNTWRELEVNLGLLDDEGIAAAAEAYASLSPPQDDVVAQAGN